MRRIIVSAFAVALCATYATQALSQEDPDESQQRQDDRRAEDARQRRLDRQFENNELPIPDTGASGPCPFVKVLYDAARTIDFVGAEKTAANVAWSGEIQGVTADCTFNTDNSITVRTVVTFSIGRGPRAEGSQKQLDYWVAVTHRNAAILGKENLSVGVQVPSGSDRVLVFERLDNINIPRASKDISADNFEILVGFNVTQEMADFNRQGSRFLINADGSAGRTATSAP